MNMEIDDDFAGRCELGDRCATELVAGSVKLYALL